MNKRYALVVSFVFLILAAALCFAMISKREGKHDESVTEAFKLESTAGEHLYTVKANGEKIGVYDNLSDRLYLSVDTYIFTLPEKDRSLIENGFVVEKSEIYDVVEDYTG